MSQRLAFLVILAYLWVMMILLDVCCVDWIGDRKWAIVVSLTKER
jgi:hypothetical protein